MSAVILNKKKKSNVSNFLAEIILCMFIRIHANFIKENIVKIKSISIQYLAVSLVIF